MCEFLQLSCLRRWLRSQLSVSITADTETGDFMGAACYVVLVAACSGGNGSPYLSELSARNFMLAVFRGHKWEDQGQFYQLQHLAEQPQPGQWTLLLPPPRPPGLCCCSKHGKVLLFLNIMAMSKVICDSFSLFCEFERFLSIYLGQHDIFSWIEFVPFSSKFE